jgi:hypothetical protein
MSQMTDVFLCPDLSSRPSSAPPSALCSERSLRVDIANFTRFVSCLNIRNRTAADMYKIVLYQNELMKRSLWGHVNASFHTLSPHLFSSVPNWSFLRGSAAAERYSRKQLLEVLPRRFVQESEGSGDAMGFVPLTHLMHREEQYADFSAVLYNQGAALSKLDRCS